jgi:redox-sensitive bicupin YhaK (pirin superfamily)
VYVLTGEGKFEDSENKEEKVTKGQMVIFNKDGDSIKIIASENKKDTLQLLLIAGKPINEPIARYGPFVMNTKQEVYQAIEDYRSGKLGIINH